MTRQEIFDYALNRYGAEPEYLWASAPNYAVLRRRDNQKWFAIVMDELTAYKTMHRDLQAEYDAACARMEALRAEGKTKTVTYKTLFARKLTLRDWLDTYARYGLEAGPCAP